MHSFPPLAPSIISRSLSPCHTHTQACTYEGMLSRMSVHLSFSHSLWNSLRNSRQKEEKRKEQKNYCRQHLSSDHTSQQITFFISNFFSQLTPTTEYVAGRTLAGCKAAPRQPVTAGVRIKINKNKFARTIIGVNTDFFLFFKVNTPPRGISPRAARTRLLRHSS